MVVGFRCDVISCELARRGVERDTAEASSSGGVRRVWAFLDHVSFFLVTLIVYFCVYHYTGWSDVTVIYGHDTIAMLLGKWRNV